MRSVFMMIKLLTSVSLQKDYQNDIEVKRIPLTQ